MPTITTFIAVLATLFLCWGIAHAADATADAEPPHWSQDADCRATFFAVLEGCYREGVPNAVIDAIITPPETEDPSLRHSFVFSCRLCHAAYDAFVTYRNRPPFYTTPDQPEISHFASDDPQAEERWASLLQDLRSDDPARRVIAMGKNLMRPWIVDYYQRQNLSADELQERINSLLVLANEGASILRRDKQDPESPYRDWNFYGGCQACEAVSDLSRLQRKLP